MTLHLAVVGHVSRLEQARGLYHRVTDELPAVSETHQVQEHRLFIDHLTLGSTWNHLRALNWGATKAGHLIVLEDDAEPVDGFLELAVDYIGRFPDRMISYYLGTDTRRHQQYIPAWIAAADREGRDWLEAHKLLHAVAYSIPCALIPTLGYRATKFAADEMLSTATKSQVIYTMPSLVDHADTPSIENAGRRHQPPRKAWRASLLDPRVSRGLPEG